jgi:HEAT repeat protein
MRRGVMTVVLLLTLALPASGQGADPVLAERLQRLLGWLEDPDPGVRWEGAMLLGELGAAAGSAVPALTAALRDGDGDVRRQAVSTLVEIGAPAATPGLIEALASADAAVRREAAQALAEIGPPAPAAVPGLSRALDDSEVEVRQLAVEALGTIGGAAAVSALVGALGSTREETREQAAIALGGCEPADIPSPVRVGDAALVIPALTQALDDPVAEVRAAAADALGGAGVLPDVAVPALIRALEDPDLYVRASAARALGAFGPLAAPAVSALAEALSDDDRGAPPPTRLLLSGTEPGVVRQRAAETLAKIGPSALDAVPALAQALGDPVDEVRRAALQALETIGRVLKLDGTVAWWVVPRVFQWELLAVGCFVAVWFAFASRFPRRRSSSRSKALAELSLTAFVPIFAVCGLTGHAVSRSWAEGFLPEPALSVLPFPVAAVLTAGFVCALVAVWVCWRKESEAPAENWPGP